MYGLRDFSTSRKGSAIYVIAVHGVSGRETTWESLGSGIPYVEFYQSQDMPVALYSYPLVEDGSNVFTKDGIRCEALRLLEAIRSSHITQEYSLRFIGHDIGGLLIKETLLQAVTGDAKFREIYWSLSVVPMSKDLPKYILDEKPSLVNEEDCDGWTPLFWAVRECDRWGIESANRRAIVEELKRRGANIMIQGEGVIKRWTPYELARYYDIDDSIVKLLTPSKEMVKSSADAAFWRRILDPSDPCKMANKLKDSSYCYVCLMTNVGMRYECQDCERFVLCFKCYRSRELIHPHHELWRYDQEYEEFDDSDDDSEPSSDSERHSGSDSESGSSGMEMAW